MSTSSLDCLLAALRSLPPAAGKAAYRIPTLWTTGRTGAEAVEPAPWFASIIEGIMQEKPVQPPEGTRAAYNLFVRYGTAFDHDGDGKVSGEPLPSGFRETGTLLKAIALLPWIKGLGTDTIYLLPLSLPGTERRKGSLGSPYAARDPYQLDAMLAEPALPLSPEALYRAFVDAAHHLGMRVVQEFVFRTASVDSHWVKGHPDWFYWLKEGEGSQEYGPPHFGHDTLKLIYEKVDKHDMQELPEPDAAFRNRFARHPVVVHEEDGHLVGTDADGTRCLVASAFADWPPDDRQPPWTDVTYLRMHTPERFDYIAYNTVRQYDASLHDPATWNTALWQEIAAVIPHYQEAYGIDGAMMDMGHALPLELKGQIVAKARELRLDFTFWDENFDPTPAIRDEGFDAVFGSLPFVLQDIIYLRGLLNFLNRTGVALPFFGTGENHNTPRVCFRNPNEPAGRNFSRFIFALASILPSMPFIHGGMEISEWRPVNLGLNFTEEDRATWRAEALPLFSTACLDWEGANGLEPLDDWIRTVLAARSRHEETIINGTAGSIQIPWVSEERIFAIKRPAATGPSILFIGNSDRHERLQGFMEFGVASARLYDLYSGRQVSIENHRLELELGPGDCLLLELPGEG